MKTVRKSNRTEPNRIENQWQVEANKNDNNKRNKNDNGNDNKNWNNSNRPFCKNCKRRHDRECLKNSNKHFLWWEIGHLKRDCPKNKDKEITISAKLNAANGGDVAKNKLVHGMITIYDTPVLHLFDLGYTHSYLSWKLVRELGSKLRVLDPPLNVSTLNDNKILVDKQVRPILMQVLNKSKA